MFLAALARVWSFVSLLCISSIFSTPFLLVQLAELCSPAATTIVYNRHPLSIQVITESSRHYDG